MPLSVSDARSNPSSQVEHAIGVIGRSRSRLAIFKAIYYGKKRIKTVNEIATATGIDRKRVLDDSRLLADNGLVNQNTTAGMVAYEKDRFYAARKRQIINLVQNPVAISNFSKKTNSDIRKIRPTIIKLRDREIRHLRMRFITIDEIDSFSRVTRTKVEPGDYKAMAESRFKSGISKILCEGRPKNDWGGERNDIYTNRLRIRDRRLLAAFALKGVGTKGPLTPKKMGKNGDQIVRLFRSSATVFLVQYWGKIDESVIDQMDQSALYKSMSMPDTIYYGIIDGDDSNRIIKAYPKAFQLHN